MSVHRRLGARMSAALVVVAVPASMVGLTPAMQPVAKTMPAVVRASAQVSLAPIAPSVTSLQRHYLSHVPPGLRPQVVAEQVTIAAGLSLRTKADRNRKISVTSSKGSRVWTASALAEHDLPSAAMRAYTNAARSIDATDPGCHLPWTLLAGIGRVESDHGRYGGSVLGNDGVPRPAIIGVALDGKGPVAAIRDTDHGAFDGDTVWDRAVGPMQFIPSTWEWAGRDGDGDGKVNPDDIDDTALAAAAYLCSGSGSMLDDAAAKAAIFRYNPSDYYVALVQAFEQGYRTGIFVLPSPPPPGQDDGPKKHRHHKAADKKKAHHAATTTKATPKPAADDPSPKPSSPSPKPSPSPSPKPSPTPSPTPKPSPSPSPSGPSLVTLSGSLTACDGGWCVGTRNLDLGPGTQLSGTAAHDFDGDGATESMTDELTGMAGTDVTLQVGDGTTPAVVYVIDGVDYRFADGTFA